MLNDLYNQRILELAAHIPHLGKLEEAQSTATAHSKLCGSTIAVELNAKKGVVTHYAQDVKACALGQAASSIMGHNIIGSSFEELRGVRQNVFDMLKNNAPPLIGKWEDLRVLEPVRDYKARHASTLLVFDAVVQAIDKIDG